MGCNAMRSSWASASERPAHGDPSYAAALERGGIDWTKLTPAERARIAADSGAR